MSDENDDEDLLRRLQDQFDKIVDSTPLTPISEQERERRRLIQERKDQVKKELDENAQGTTTNELNE
jgi:hypothetical protein